MWFCATDMATYNSLEFFKGASLKEKGEKKKAFWGVCLYWKKIFVFYFILPPLQVNNKLKQMN